MSNELLFIISIFADIFFISLVARRGVDWLFGTIILNLVLIAIFGAKLISVFDLTTNAGNVFYACVFFATYLILERQGKKGGLRIIWMGSGFIIFFALLSQLSTQLHGLSLSSSANEALAALFSFSLRITFASVLAYVFAQYVNVSIYEWLKARVIGKSLWVRSNVANIVSQLVDSLLFFTIAFPELPGPLLVQTILVGWLVKAVIVSLGTPMLYLDAYLERKKHG